MVSFKIAVIVGFIVYSETAGIPRIFKRYFGSPSIFKRDTSDDLDQELNQKSLVGSDISKRYFSMPQMFKRDISDELNQELEQEFLEDSDISKRYFGSPSIFKRQSAGHCFERVDDIEQQEDNIAAIFNADSVRKCFTRLNIDPKVFHTFSANDTERSGEVFDAEAARYCPSWPTSKKCIFNYLKSNSTLGSFNPFLCSKLSGWSNVGLADCFSKHGNHQKFMQCTTNKRQEHVESGFIPPFKRTAKEFIACVQTIATDCAAGNNSTELEMSVILNLIDDTLGSSFDLFWEEFRKE
ncbi:unnamed protein product [Allacma fusca]|uniref:Uncharacterized protein n=1 Tax=Allacma fusca TaxID=39272 RepID=A0A8J2PFK0_9HEXA|nr:unnamed protein product [Allacma fusca]